MSGARNSATGWAATVSGTEKMRRIKECMKNISEEVATRMTFWIQQLQNEYAVQGVVARTATNPPHSQTKQDAIAPLRGELQSNRDLAAVPKLRLRSVPSVRAIWRTSELYASRNEADEKNHSMGVLAKGSYMEQDVVMQKAAVE